MFERMNSTVLLLISIFLMVAFLMPASTTVEGVNYNKIITDNQGDVDAVDAEDYADDADIVSISTLESGGVITLDLSVVGTIHTSVTGTEDSVRYVFFIDINPPEAEDEKRTADWMITIYKTCNQDIMNIVDNNAEYEYILPEELVTGGGTSTLTVIFPLEIITDEITGWDIKGMTDISFPSDSSPSSASAEDKTGGSWSWEFGGSDEEPTPVDDEPEPAKYEPVDDNKDGDLLGLDDDGGNGLEESDEDDSPLPGFGSIIAITSIGVALIISRVYLRKY